LLKKVGRFWWLDIWIEGKRFRRSLKTESKFEARVKAKEVERQLREQYAGGKPKFSDFCETYLEWAWSSKPASALREQQRLSKIREFFSGQKIIHLDDITPYHIERLRTELKKEKLSKATINRYTQILRGLFYKAIDWEIYNKPNPLKKIRFYKENSRREALSATEIACDTAGTLAPFTVRPSLSRLRRGSFENPSISHTTKQLNLRIF